MTDDWTGRRVYTRTFLVVTDNNANDGESVLEASNSLGLPAIGDRHPENDAALVTERNPEQDSAYPRRWFVTVVNDTQPGGPAGGDNGAASSQQESLLPNTANAGTFPSDSGGNLGGAPNGGALGSQSTSAASSPQTPGQRPDNPLERPYSVSGSFQQTTEVLREAFKTDDNGNNVKGSKSVLNSAGLMFDPPVTVEVSRPLMRIKKNYAELYLANLCELQDAINYDWFKGFPPRTLRCVGIEYESGYENGTAFWSVTYNFAVNWLGWEIRVLDAGLYERFEIGTDAATGKPVYEWRAIRDKHGEPITEPVPLDGKGKKKKPDDPETYLVFSAYKQRLFNSLIIV